ncbi:MAG: glycosyltransferase family 2 protein [Candidatus Andersenbacteria bacterium]|nr:glycosyltransferase family 2 protein [Candidatus Andersenbacteria bacterium]
MTPKVTIQLVGWNSAAVLPEALSAIRSIPREAATVRYIDNASTDSSGLTVRRELPLAEIIELPENRGFAGGHNVGLERCRTPYVLILNPDAIVLWDGVEQLLSLFEDARVGAVQGKIFRDAKQRILDSCGVEMTKSFNGRDRGAGEDDVGQFDREADIAAVTGAAGLYRLSALQAVAQQDGEIFDEDFFAYKEDVDLGWRLRRAGWRIVYRPVPMAVHRRALGAGTALGWSSRPRQLYRRLQDKRTYYSLRNWVWMLVKNITWREEMRAEIFIDARLLLFMGLSLLYWPLLRVWLDVLREMPKMLAKRNPSTYGMK